MDTQIKIAVWNSNGLQQRIQETKAFIHTHDIDILLVSETHLTDKNYINIPHYTMYDTKHPSGKAHGGTAIIIKNEIYIIYTVKQKTITFKPPQLH